MEAISSEIQAVFDAMVATRKGTIGTRTVVNQWQREAGVTLTVFQVVQFTEFDANTFFLFGVANDDTTANEDERVLTQALNYKLSRTSGESKTIKTVTKMIGVSQDAVTVARIEDKTARLALHPIKGSVVTNKQGVTKAEILALTQADCIAMILDETNAVGKGKKHSTQWRHFVFNKTNKKMETQDASKISMMIQTYLDGEGIAYSVYDSKQYAEYRKLAAKKQVNRTSGNKRNNASPINPEIIFDGEIPIRQGGEVTHTINGKDVK